jgi:hypothetical protein
MCVSGDAPFPSPAARAEFIMNLYAPLVFDEATGRSVREQSLGLISRETALRLLTEEL